MSTKYVQIDVDSVLSRIKNICDLKSDAELAEFFGVSRATPSGWRQRNSLDLNKLIEKLGHENLDWLLLGRGERTKKSNNVAYELMGSDEFSGLLTGARDGDLSIVKVYDVEVSAGEGAEIGNASVVSYIAFLTSYLKVDVGLNPGKAFIAQVRGRSMEHLLYSGDLVLGETVVEIEYDDIYCVRLNSEMLVKHVQRLGDRLVLKPENRSYGDIEVFKHDDFEVIGIVRRRITRM